MGETTREQKAQQMLNRAPEHLTEHDFGCPTCALGRLKDMLAEFGDDDLWLCAAEMALGRARVARMPGVEVAHG